MEDDLDITLGDVLEASVRVAPYVRTTPVAESPWLSEVTGAHVFLKLENLQVTGSFKARGAVSKLLFLTSSERSRGVIAASAGNHAQGVAYAAARLGISALIVIPEGTPATKMAGIRRYGAELRIVGANYDESEAFAWALAASTGRVMVHAFEDAAVVAGQGTVALETLLWDPAWDSVLVPAGGGGLIAGMGTVVKAIRPAASVIGVQSEASPAWYESFRAGHVVGVEYRPTLAEGLLGGIGRRNFALVRRVADRMELVNESAIAQAMAGLAQEHHLMVEGSGAVGVAALLSGVVRPARASRILVVISGGNVDAKRLARLILAEEGAPPA